MIKRSFKVAADHAAQVPEYSVLRRRIENDTACINSIQEIQGYIYVYEMNACINVHTLYTVFMLTCISSNK